MKIVILGAGNLGAAIARKLAESGVAGEIVLYDSAVGTAQGKALDLLQSGPILGFRTQLSGSAAPDVLCEAHVMITADMFQGEGKPLDEGRAVAFFQALAPRRGDSLLVVAEDYGARLAELAVLHGRFPFRSVMGSAAIAIASATRAHLAQELGCVARDLQLPLFGLLPSPLIIPWSMASYAGIPIEKMAHVSVLRRTSQRLLQKPRIGPYVLAAAAVALVGDLMADRRATHPVLAFLKNEYQQRDRFLVVPARVGRTGVQEILDLPLDPVDRVALERLRQG